MYRSPSRSRVLSALNDLAEMVSARAGSKYPRSRLHIELKVLCFLGFFFGFSV